MIKSKANSCDDKISFNSNMEAILAIRHMVRDKVKNSWELHSYKCNYCEGFHVGHMRRKEQSLIKEVVKAKRPQCPIVKIKRN